MTTCTTDQPDAPTSAAAPAAALDAPTAVQVITGEIVAGPIIDEPTRAQGFRRITTGLRHIITGPPGRHRRR